jgi:hypothetical protein
MSTELEKDVAAALRFRAAEVAETPCPPLGASRPNASRRGWLVPVTAAAAVAGLAAAGVAFLPGDSGTGPAPNPAISAAAPDQPAAGEVYYSHQKARISPDRVGEFELWQGQGRIDAWQTKHTGVEWPGPTTGECWPAPTTTDAQCTAPGTWFHPNVEFLAAAPRDPAVIKQQLRQEATAEEERRTAPGGDFTTSANTFSDENLDYLAFNYLRGVLSANGLPADLEPAIEQVIAATPGIQVTQDMANLDGKRGTGYGLADYSGTVLTVIIDEDHHYIGSPEESFERGFAPGLGRPPTRVIG